MTYLNNEQKKALIEQRLVQFSAEKYQHELNRKLAEAVNDEQAIAQADNAIAVIDTAIGLHETELASLDN